MESPKAISLQSLATMVFVAVMMWAGNRVYQTSLELAGVAAESKCSDRRLEELRARILQMEKSRK